MSNPCALLPPRYSFSKSWAGMRAGSPPPPVWPLKKKAMRHILFCSPKLPSTKSRFIQRVDATVKARGYCVIVASEGAQYADGTFLADAGTVDAFGHKQLGGVAPTLAQMVKAELGYKYHWALADYLQRAARHIASAVDVEQAYAVGKAAVEMAVDGKNGVMPANYTKCRSALQLDN